MAEVAAAAAAGMSVATGIGIASGIIGFATTPIFLASAILAFKQYVSNLPPQNGATAVRIYTGFGEMGNGGCCWEGNTPGVALFDSIGRSVGFQVGEKQITPANSYRDLKVPHFKDQKRVSPEYISISEGGKDGICVAQVDITNDDGTKSYLSGDVVANCFGNEIPVYPSLHYIGDDNRQPYCFWLDRDRSLDSGKRIMTQGVSWHIPSMWATKERAAQYADHKESLCNVAARLKWWDSLNVDDKIDVFNPPPKFNLDLTDKDPLGVKNAPTTLSESAWKNGGGKNPHRVHPIGWWGRSLQGRAPGNGTEEEFEIEFDEQFDTVSDEDARQARIQRDERFAKQVARQRTNGHSAIAVCQNPNTVGPNFLSLHDGWFCDITSRILYPVCEPNDQNKRACYDLEEEEIRELEEDDEEDDGEQDKNVTLDARGLVTNSTVLNSAKFRFQKKKIMKRKVHRKFTEIIDWGLPAEA